MHFSRTACWSEEAEERRSCHIREDREGSSTLRIRQVETEGQGSQGCNAFRVVNTSLASYQEAAPVISTLYLQQSCQFQAIAYPQIDMITRPGAAEFPSTLDTISVVMELVFI